LETFSSAESAGEKVCVCLCLPRLPLQACPPAKPSRHSPEAQPLADGQGEAAWGTIGQGAIGMMEQWNTDPSEIETSFTPVRSAGLTPVQSA